MSGFTYPNEEKTSFCLRLSFQYEKIKFSPGLIILERCNFLETNRGENIPLKVVGKLDPLLFSQP